MTHSEKSHICQMKAWPYRQECRGHDHENSQEQDTHCKVEGKALLGKSHATCVSVIHQHSLSGILQEWQRGDNDNDNDNDNDTLREVPHPSNEGLALQARVSGPWPHKKKESVVPMKLAHWQGVQVQTVRGQIVSQRDLRWTQCKKEMRSN